MPAGADSQEVLPLNVVMIVVGTRGDVQPFIYIGKQLSRRGHRVRLATHASFRGFVADMSGGDVQFFPLGGDPKTMIEFVVKNRRALRPRTVD